MNWTPCAAHECVDDMVWLKRMVQKARQLEASRTAGTDLMNGYLFGRNDYVDGKALRFLNIGDQDVLEAVRSEPDDVRAAQALLRRSGRSVEERRSFSRRLRRSMANFALFEADEGRLAPGPRTSLIRFFYNRMLMPLVYLHFNAAERRRAARG